MLGLDRRVPEARKIAPAHIIDQNHDDVRLSAARLGTAPDDGLAMNTVRSRPHDLRYRLITIAPSLRRPVGRLAAGGLQVGVDLRGDLRMLGGDVGLLGNIILQVIQRQRSRHAALADSLPAPLVQGGLAEATLVELPVKPLVLGLVGGSAEERAARS